MRPGAKYPARTAKRPGRTFTNWSTSQRTIKRTESRKPITDGIIQSRGDEIRIIKLRITEGSVEVLTHPEGNGCINIPHKGHVKKTIKELEGLWNAKSVIVTDFFEELADKEHIIMRRSEFRARTRKLIWELPQGNFLYWQPPNGDVPHWYAWIKLKTSFHHGYYPSKAEITEAIPILESITGGKWKWDDNRGLICYEWSPEMKKKTRTIFDFK